MFRDPSCPHGIRVLSFLPFLNRLSCLPIVSHWSPIVEITPKFRRMILLRGSLILYIEVVLKETTFHS